MLARKNRLRKNREFQKVYRFGRSVVNKYLVLYILENGLGYNRVGFSISKKLGKAVKRNYIKRVLSDLYHQKCSKIAQGYDLVFIVRRNLKDRDFQTILEALENILQRSKLYSGRGD